MEGPSLKIAEEQLKPFKKKKILKVEGNTKIGKERLENLIVKDIFSWGKHLVFQFEPFAMRVHFMLYGTFEAVVEGESVTGDYKRAREARLQLTFPNGTISMYNGSIKFVEEKNAKKSYDFSTDIMSKKWDPASAYLKVKKQPKEQIDDILLDQEIFSGVGNIIKNEVLSMVKVHPETLVKDISPKVVKELIAVTYSFSQQFYKWRKKFVLRKNLTIYRRSACPHCGTKVTRGKTGKRARWSFWCPHCQKLPKK